ncbi:MAG: GNAT family N-acetyltransferase [Desulforhabdus sp.]|jgi:hypothetical protein|nr:GNAT family N-acetyltransferase [Desulforhabdus sp.]
MRFTIFPSRKNSPANSTSVKTYREAAELPKLKTSWEEMELFPTAGYDYFHTLIECRDHAIRPHVIALNRGDRITALAIGRIERIEKQTDIKGLLKFKSTIRSILFDIGCFAGDFSESNSRLIVSELLASLKKGEADMAIFSEVPISSALYACARRIPAFCFRDFFPRIQGHYRMTLPDTPEQFYKAHKKAKNLRRIGNRLARDFEGRVRIQCFRDEADVERFCTDADLILRHASRYTPGMGFTERPEQGPLLKTLAAKGQMLAFVLYLDEAPAAFEGGVVHDQAYFADYCGYDQRFRKYEIGSYLEIKVIEHLCRQEGFGYYDFGWMDTFHKNRYCDILTREANFEIYAPSFKGLLLNTKKTLYHLIGPQIGTL